MMFIGKRMGLFVVLMAIFAVAKAEAQDPPKGVVYGCYSSSTSGPSFVLIDGTTYNSRQGGVGTYKYDAASGVLSMLSGPYEGIHYLKESASFTFRVLRDNMTQTATSCPINVGKDPNKRPW